MEEEEKPKKSFKQFLDESTNLLTIFGILNAVFVFSTTISNNHITEFLLAPLSLLSIVVLIVLIDFTLKSADGTRKYEFFYYLLCMIGLGMVMFFVSEFYSQIFGILSLFLIIFYFYGVFRLLIFLVTKIIPPKGIKKLNSHVLLITFLILTIIIGVLFFKLFSPVINVISHYLILFIKGIKEEFTKPYRLH